MLCYFSAGSFEDWRDDAADCQTTDLGNTLSGYADECWLDIRSAAVFSVILARLDLALSLLQPFITAGKPVLNAEYLTSYQNNPNSVCIDAQQANIRTLVLCVDLDDSFYYNCDTDYP